MTTDINKIIHRLQKKGYNIVPYTPQELAALPPPPLPVKENIVVGYLPNVAAEVGQALGCIMRRVRRQVKEGANVADIDKWLLRESGRAGMYPSVYGYEGFPKASCISVNEAICHGVPYPRKLQKGDIVKVDMCLYKDGVHSDMADTFVVGQGRRDPDRLVRTTYDALDTALRVCRPGALYRDIGTVVSKCADDHGLHVVERLSGHGIGKHIHMNPTVKNVPNKSKEVMREGHMFTIEPLLATRSGKRKTLSDGNTIVTADGGLAAHVERVVLITEGGYRLLQEE